MLIVFFITRLKILNNLLQNICHCYSFTCIFTHLVLPHVSLSSAYLLMLVGFFSSIQNDIFEWARDHRVHHKYSETDADPHNATRGFFFSHIGWLLVRKHPDVIEKGKKLELSDLKADSVVMFQRQ